MGSVASGNFFQGRQGRLPVLLAIVLLHVLFFLCWSAKIHKLPRTEASVLLPVWNVIEPTRKLPDNPVKPHTDVAPPAVRQPVQKSTQKTLPAPTEVQPSVPQAEPAPPVATSPAATSPAAPRLDYDGIRNQALDMDKHRDITPAERLHQEQFVPHTVESGMADAAKRGTRGDCQTAYAGAGLLAVVPLLIDTVTNRGCKWK